MHVFSCPVQRPPDFTRIVSQHGFYGRCACMYEQRYDRKGFSQSCCTVPLKQVYT